LLAIIPPKFILFAPIILAASLSAGKLPVPAENLTIPYWPPPPNEFKEV
jgi:hypothetical protein